MSRKAPVFCQCYWTKPKFGDTTVAFYMNVRRLAFIRTKKDETKWAILKHGRHSVFFYILFYIKFEGFPYATNRLRHRFAFVAVCGTRIPHRNRTLPGVRKSRLRRGEVEVTVEQ